MLYHRLGEGKLGNNWELLKEHFKFIQDNFNIILPGDSIKGPSICLTFDDAFFDFYDSIFPFLLKHQMRSVVAVAPKYISAKTSVRKQARLAVPYSQAMKEGIYQSKVPHCTWEELKEMSKTGYVEIASHSYSHPDLSNFQGSLEKEIIDSKNEIELRLNQAVSTFIYPFGKFNNAVCKCVKQHYAYDMRIGNAYNQNWQSKMPLMRINGDRLDSAQAPFLLKNKMGYLAKYLINSFKAFTK